MDYPTYLIHYGTLGQKWGIRKYQNEDGTWTEEGLRRRRKEQADLYKSIKKDVKKGKFNTDDYRYNSFVRNEIEKKDLYNLMKKRNKEQASYDKINKKYEEYNAKYNKVRDKYEKIYQEEIDKELKNKKFKNEDDRYNAYEAARWRAEDKYRDQYMNDLDKEGWSYKAPSKPSDEKLRDLNNKTAWAIDEVSDSIIGKYSNKNIHSIKINEPYRAYVNDIIKDVINKEVKNMEDREKMIKEYTKKIPKMQKELENADMITEDRYWKLRKNNVSEEEIFKKDKRLDDAAVTGLKALEGKDVDLSAGNKFWFVCEDQTIGYTTIADLANRGYSEKQIKDLVKTANEYYYNPIHDETAYDLGMKIPKGTWHLTELYDGDKFIEDCVKVAKENTLSDAKQSRIKSLIASGKSQEEVAKMLGVSTSTVNKYK